MPARSIQLALTAFVASCATSPTPAALLFGTREWSGPAHTGQLELSDDTTFLLSLRIRPDGDRCDVRGEWCAVASTPGFRCEDLVVLLVRSVQWRSTCNDESPPLAPFQPGDEVSALVSNGGATYLGLGGVVDLNWGM
jgi:hypothetical protein